MGKPFTIHLKHLTSKMQQTAIRLKQGQSCGTHSETMPLIAWIASVLITERESGVKQPVGTQRAGQSAHQAEIALAEAKHVITLALDLGAAARTVTKFNAAPTSLALK